MAQPSGIEIIGIARGGRNEEYLPEYESHCTGSKYDDCIDYDSYEVKIGRRPDGTLVVIVDVRFTIKSLNSPNPHCGIGVKYNAGSMAELELRNVYLTSPVFPYFMHFRRYKVQHKVNYIFAVEKRYFHPGGIHFEFDAIPGTYSITVTAYSINTYAVPLSHRTLFISTMTPSNPIVPAILDDVRTTKPGPYAAPGEPFRIVVNARAKQTTRVFTGLCYVDGPAEAVELVETRGLTRGDLCGRKEWLTKKPEVPLPTPELVVLRRGQCYGHYGAYAGANITGCLFFPAEGRYVLRAVAARAPHLPPVYDGTVGLDKLEVFDAREVAVDVSTAGAYKLRFRLDGGCIYMGGLGLICPGCWVSVAIDCPDCWTYTDKIPSGTSETPYFAVRSFVKVAFDCPVDPKARLDVELVDMTGRTVGRCSLSVMRDCTIRAPLPPPPQPSPSPVRPSPVYPSPVQPSPVRPPPAYPSPSPRAPPGAPGVPSWAVPAAAGAGALVIGAVAGTVALRRRHAA